MLRGIYLSVCMCEIAYWRIPSETDSARRRFADKSEKIALDRILRLTRTRRIVCFVHMEFGPCLGEKTPKSNELKNIKKNSLKSRSGSVFVHANWLAGRKNNAVALKTRSSGDGRFITSKPYAVCEYIRVRIVHRMHTYSSARLIFRRCKCRRDLSGAHLRVQHRCWHPIYT